MDDTKTPTKQSQGKLSQRKPSKLIAESNLATLCREVIVANLERYPPEAFGICNEEDWVAIAELRHKRSRPKEGSGGLDGTGRMVPSVKDTFLEAVEKCNPHLSECAAVDEMLWRDCVEYRFQRTGLKRPDALLYPWPVLVEHTKTVCNSLLFHETTGSELANESKIRNSVHYLSKCPMSVPLLRDSSAGKILKKVIKSDSDVLCNDDRCQLEKILDSWKALAVNAGIHVKGNLRSPAMEEYSQNEEMNDLSVAETCMNWRQLYFALKVREEERRHSQGKRMREIRHNLAATRPKLVKVRPTTNHQNIMGCDVMANKSNPKTGTKLLQVRKEAISQTNRLRVQTTTKDSFAQAVAFASGTAKVKKSATVLLAGNKRMKIPTLVVKGAGPRQFASKWKNLSNA